MTSEGMEKKTLSAFLAAQRASVLAIVDGLDTQALTSSVLPSGWTPLGLVEHLGHAERHWFQEVVTGAAEPLTCERRRWCSPSTTTSVGVPMT
ncbi:DUF664 domain-containing protein [Streptomyces sp. NPDC048301]|uniref:mycothiol transferase n=1 Tax=Streptomyces sp. NPDC048301 TaxID=3155631 RepID=UPI0034449C73